MSRSETVLLDRHEGVATVTLNRPEVLNALNDALGERLDGVLSEIEADPSVRVVVVRGAGGSFMAGGDIGEFRSKLGRYPDKAEFRVALKDMIEQGQRLALKIRRLPKPVIASVEGGCAGWGFSLMTACDLVIAANNAKFTLAFIHLGTTPDGGVSFHLPRVVGMKRAAEIALLGDRFGAAEAEQWGLVNRVVPQAELATQTAKLAARLARGPALAYARTKALLNASAANDLEAQLRAETEAFADSALSADFAAGVAAFFDKKPPKFEGR